MLPGPSGCRVGQSKRSILRSAQCSADKHCETRPRCQIKPSAPARKWEGYKRQARGEWGEGKRRYPRMQESRGKLTSMCVAELPLVTLSTNMFAISAGGVGPSGD